MNFKDFIDTMLLEGGAALKTSPVSQTDARKALPQIIKQVSSVLGISAVKIKQLGSAGKKPKDEDVSGDIDLAVQAEAAAVEKVLKDLAYDGKTFKIMKGINVYSFAYDLGGKTVQVDLMPVSNVRYAEWASQANELDLKDGLKGSHRNELYFAIAKYIDPQILKRDADGSPIVLKRYFYDLQKGLMLGTQSREGKKKNGKNFKTVDKKVLTDDPVKVAQFLFGDHVTPDQVSTFKGTLAAITSPKFPHKAARDEIIAMSKLGMKNKGLIVPKYL
jgi:hypothetical protein